MRIMTTEKDKTEDWCKHWYVIVSKKVRAFRVREISGMQSEPVGKLQRRKLLYGRKH